MGYQKQMNNLFKVISKPDITNEMTRRTEGTTVETTIQKTFDSHNNSIKDQIKNPISQKPPRGDMKNRPISNGINSGLFYKQQEHDMKNLEGSVKSGKHEIISLSVDRNQIKLGKSTNPPTVQSRTSNGSGHILDKY